LRSNFQVCVGAPSLYAALILIFLVPTLKGDMAASAVKKLAGKVAIVTASTEGIGFFIARRLGQDGAKVMISSRKQQNVDNALSQLRAENLNVEGIVCHVAKKEDRLRLIKETSAKFGGVDILVSNAAVSTYFGPTLK
ncbi:unnamed protein product, partial [Lymnaea stagnalis]